MDEEFYKNSQYLMKKASQFFQDLKTAHSLNKIDHDEFFSDKQKRISLRQQLSQSKHLKNINQQPFREAVEHDQLSLESWKNTKKDFSVKGKYAQANQYFAKLSESSVKKENQQSAYKKILDQSSHLLNSYNSLRRSVSQNFKQERYENSYKSIRSKNQSFSPHLRSEKSRKQIQIYRSASKDSKQILDFKKNQQNEFRQSRYQIQKNFKQQMRKFNEINYEYSKCSPLRDRSKTNVYSLGNSCKDFNNQSHKIEVYKSEKSVRFIQF